VHPSLRGYATAVVESAVESNDADRVVEELAQVEELIAEHGELAAVLTDSAVPVTARRGVVEDLLSSRVRPGTLRLVLRALGEGRADQFPVALHDVREFTRVLVGIPGETELEENVRGRGAVRALLSGFCAAVFETLTVAGIEQVEDELFRFARIIESNPDLRSALSDPGRARADRQALVSSLLEGRVDAATVRLVRATLDVPTRDLVQMLDWLVERAAEARGWRVARVHAAREIAGTERTGLEEALRRLTGVPVELQVTFDADLLGGVVIEVGDLLVDASARHRLEQLQEHLLGAEGATRGAMS
jgi:F-type H+-transporting ATPase subunit delta